MSARIVFLGTGGGRHATMFQARSTGGFIIEDGSRIHVDPGPGALTNMHNIGYNLQTTDAVVVSHAHPDHYSDAEVVVEGMCKGGWVKRGSLYGSVSVIDGSGTLGPCLSPYHQNLPVEKHVLRPGDVYDIAGIRTEIQRSQHSDPTNVGFRFDTSGGVVAYVSDTEYTDGIADQYKGARALILPVTTPSGNRIRYHTCTDDAITFAERVKPEVVILTHLGIVMLRHDPVAQAKMVEDATGIRTIAAEDLMTVDIGKDIVFGKAPLRKPGWDDAWNL